MPKKEDVGKENPQKVTVLYKREVPERPHKGFSRREIEQRREAIRRANPDGFISSWKKHKYWLPRAIYAFFHGVWLVVMAVGGFIAWLIATLFI